MSVEHDYGLLDPRAAQNANRAGYSHVRERIDASGTLPEVIKYDRMLRKLGHGVRNFDDYDFPVYILNSELFSCEETSIGVTDFTARLHLLGEHYRNERGWYLPSDKAQNLRQEDETIGYGIVRVIDQDPTTIHTSLPGLGSAEFKKAEALYCNKELRAERAANVAYVLEKVAGLRIQPTQLEPGVEVALSSSLAAD